LGICDGNSDMTIRPNGQFVAYGNQSMTLVED